MYVYINYKNASFLVHGPSESIYGWHLIFHKVVGWLKRKVWGGLCGEVGGCGGGLNKQDCQMKKKK